jgi:isoleucyl-tRNA synthetase
MPFAQWHYPFEHESQFKAHFPADFICEGIDQTRGWFYSLLAIAAGVMDGPAYKNVIVNELVLDASGQKMSKSRGNVVNPWEVIESHGADAVRLYLLGQSQVWLPKRFDVRQVNELAGGFLNTLRHTYDFFALYAEDWKPASGSDSDGGDTERPLIDRWLHARLDATVSMVRQAWSTYDVTAGVRALIDFVVEDVSRWYVRVNRPRFWAPDRAADETALAALHDALVTVARLLAPAAPFVSDWLHRRLAGSSAHVATFPVDRGRRDPDLIAAMDAVRRLASLAHSARNAKGLGVRQPLARMRISVPAAVKGPLLADLLDILAAEVNVKAYEVVDSDHSLVSLKGKANFRSLGKRYGKDTPAAAAAVATLAPQDLQALERGETVQSGVYEFRPEDVQIVREVASDWLVQSDGPYVVALDPHLTPDLEQEGMAREVVHTVQQMRKKAGYPYTARIELAIAGDGDVIAAVAAYQAYVEGETLTRKLVLGGALEAADATQEVDINGRRVRSAVRRHDGR